MIIGLTGSFCGGKDTVAEYLGEMGFKHFSLSDILREDLRKKRKKVTRTALQKLANELREREGNGVLARRTLKKIKPGKDYVVTSIRHPDEVKALMNNLEFFLVKVDAPARLRFERMAARKREEDPQTFEEFKEMEEMEMYAKGSSQKVGECMKMARITIVNDSGVDVLHGKTDKMVGDLRKKTEEKEVKPRPSWDEYFINIMMAVAERGTCDRGKTASVIVRNNRILVTGYVGAPAGLPHCDEAGHQMKTVTHEDGKVTQHCLRTIHAELNAVAQAARDGISINGATLYCKMAPCQNCAKTLINCGIKRVVAQLRYHADNETAELFKKAGIKYEVLSEKVESYKNQ